MSDIEYQVHDDDYMPKAIVKKAVGKSKDALTEKAYWYLKMYLGNANDDELFRDVDLEIRFKVPEDRFNVDEYVDVNLMGTWHRGTEDGSVHAFRMRVFAHNFQDGTSTWYMINRGEFDPWNDTPEGDVLHMDVGRTTFEVKPIEF